MAKYNNHQTDNISELIKEGYDMGGLIQKVNNIEQTVQKISDKLDASYLLKETFDARFNPIAKIVYGLIMAVLTSLIGVLFLFISRKP